MTRHTKKRYRSSYKLRRSYRKKHTDYQKGGNEIGKQILDTIKNVEQNKNTESFSLKFTFKGFEYSTTFTVSYDKDIDIIELDNGCISHTISKNRTKYFLHSFMSSNTDDIACFTPRLKTIQSPIKITSTDVLQTLSTKLKIILYNGGYIKEIKVIDQSEINNIPLLAYRVLRGLPALYEKYGYVSKELNEFREKILPNATWNYITSIDSLKKVNTVKYISILEKYNKDNWRTQHITDLLKNVPFEEETTRLSSRILTVLLSSFKSNNSNNSNDFNSTKLVDTFILDPTSPKWQEWNSNLQFIEFSKLNTMV
jgi:hypothetical protein